MSRFQFKQSPFRLIFLLYTVFIFLFTGIYALPTMHYGSISFVDLLFLSTSAMSVTGLSTISVAHDLTKAGQVVLFLQIQFGGIGIMAFLGSMMLIFRRKVSLPYQTLMSFDQNQRNLKSVGKLMLFIVSFMVIVETVGFLCFLPFVAPHYDHFKDALLPTMFHAGASFTNAGFDLFGGSLVSFSHQPLFLFLTSVLIFLGVMGFPVVMELLTKGKRKLSLYTKVNLTVHMILIMIGFIVFLCVDLWHVRGDYSITERITNSLFFSITSRNAGMTTLDLNLLSFPSLLIMMSLMFIGGAPSSCGGGIRTTTFAVVVMKIWSIIRGKSDVQMAKKSLYEEDVNKALLVFFSFAGLFLFSLFSLSIIEGGHIRQLAFEIMSALSTTGLSLGGTASLTTFSKIWLCVLMVVGRLGIVVLIYSFVDTKPSSVKYAKESMIVG